MGKHGMSGTRIYKTWSDMNMRCYSKGCRIYKHYGARGVSVCDEWNRFNENGFSNFYNWAMSNGYADDLTIDRIDVNGNYEPSNCRWETKSVQNANRRSKGKCEYIGVYKQSDGKEFIAQIKKDGKVIFIFCSRSKNECALRRNDFIKKHNLKNPLNEVRDEFEEYIPYAKDRTKYFAQNIESGKIHMSSSSKEIGDILNVTSQTAIDCVNGKRSHPGWFVWKEVDIS